MNTIPDKTHEAPFSGTDGYGTEATQFKYDAFISYRRQGVDRKWAKWLQDRLERFVVPKKLQAPKKKLRVFRDDTELPASPDISHVIKRAISESEWLIVVCSPRTTQSDWVAAEIREFIKLGREDRILALLVEGEPDESFPIGMPDGLAPDVRARIGESRRHLMNQALMQFAGSPISL